MKTFVNIISQNNDFYVKYAQNWKLIDNNYDMFPSIKNNYLELISKPENAKLNSIIFDKEKYDENERFKYI